MNQTFSPARFARLNSWFWAIKGRTYMLGAGAWIVITLLILSQPLAVDTPDEVRALGIGFGQMTAANHLVYFNVIALILVVSLGSDVYSALYRQESAIMYLMIPASRAEKFWLGILYLVAAVILLAIIYWGYEALVFSIANTRLPAAQPERYVPTLLYYARPPLAERGLLLMPVYFIALGIATSCLGSFYFRRGVFIRNVGFGIMCMIGLMLLYHWIVGMQFNGHEVGGNAPFLAVNVHDQNRYENVAPPLWLTYLAYIGTLVALWGIARVRFNELER